MSVPVFGNREWEQCRKAVAACQEFRELRRQIIRVAAEMGAAARQACAPEKLKKQRRLDREFWRHLGVSVVESDLHHSGGHHEANGTRFIFVNTSEHRLRQRFTAAHEMGHLLLDDLRASAPTWMDLQKEERICDDFASELLIPQGALKKALTFDGKLTPQLVDALCRKFQVNLQPMLIALGQTGRFQRYAVLMAQRRGHPSRLQEIDYRVENQPFRSTIFLPKDQRLRSLGLDSVVNWAAAQNAGQQIEGRAEELMLPLWERGIRSGIATGSASWNAKTLARNGLLVFIDLSELAFQWQSLKNPT